MSTGIEVKVQRRADRYSAWVEKRRNLFINPRANSLTGFGAGTLGTRSTLTGLSESITTAYRHTRTTAATAARVVDLALGTATPSGGAQASLLVRVRASATGPLVITANPTIGSTTGQVTLGTINVTQANVFQDFAISGASFAGAATSSSGISITQTGGAVNMTVDAQAIDVELGAPGFYIDGSSFSNELQRTRWVGASNGSASVLETRTFTSGSEVLKTNTGYSVREESTSVDVTDSNGAAGSVTVELFASKSRMSTKRMTRKVVTLTDRGQGTTMGVARVPSGSLTASNITLDQRTVALSVTRTAQPFSGTLRDYFIYLFSLVGIVDGYVIDASFSTMTGIFPGWQGDVWLQLKRLLATRGAEITQASNNIIIRPIRGRVTVDKKDTDFTWTMDDSNLAQAIEGYWYDNVQRASGLAYPDGGWTEDVQIYQVDAGETIEFDIPINASLSSINQPIALDYVTREYVGPNSVYCVVGSDGLPVPAAQWLANGGALSVRIGEDTRSIIVRITGASIERYAPFRIAASAGPNDNYSSLRLIGSGVFFTKNGPVRLRTSATADDTSTEIGATVDTEFITSLSMLYDCMVWTLSRYGGPRHTINVTTTGINRSGESGSYAYPTFTDFNAYAASKGWSTFADFNTAYAGDTFQDFDAEWAATVASSFVNQAFGNVAGARTFRDGLWMRLRTSEITPGAITYSAENDTNVGDFNTWMLAQLAERGLPNTFASFNSLLAERETFADISAAPLTLEN